jgi:predicted lipid-binding transport protein (Tim44 family)
LTDAAIGLGQIKASDPDFDVDIFLKQAGQALFAVKSALQERETADIRDLVSDSVYDELRSDVMSLYTRGAVHYFDLLDIRQSTIEAAEHTQTGDHITVLFQCVAEQYTLAETRGADAIQMPPLMPFSEYWTFSRPPGVATLAERRPECPVCGAPIDIDTGRICRYCRTLLPPPRQQTGWTVVAITPAAQSTV